MSFKLKRNESPYRGLRRLMLEQCDVIVSAFDEHDLDTGIHEARKSCKKARAILRLLKAIQHSECKRENRVFREISRRLSPFRDQKVVLDCFQNVLVGMPHLEQRFQPILKLLKAGSTRIKVREGQEDELAAVIEKARECRARIEQWERPEETDGEDWNWLLAGLGKVYARGRKSMKGLNADSDDESFHDWRKRVKALGAYFKLLKHGWPRVMKATAQELSELGDLLGDEHDLWVLQEYLYEHVPGSNGKMMKLLEELVPHLNKQRQSLRSEATALGERLFAETPKAFKQRLSDYILAWQNEVASD